MFFPVLAGIIPLGLRNGGHLVTFAPLSASGGATAPSAPRLHRLCVDVSLVQGLGPAFQGRTFTGKWEQLQALKNGKSNNRRTFRKPRAPYATFVTQRMKVVDLTWLVS